MGSVVSSIGGLFGNVGKSRDSGLTMKNFDVTKEAKKYEDIYGKQLQQAQERQTAANAPAIISQLSQRALGQGPSLAEAQLRSATNRNLAQQLAAASAMRGRSPAATQRQLLQQQGEAGRNLAQDASVARLQEQSQAASQLAQQQAMADQMAQQSAQMGFNAAVAPKTAKQQYDIARSGIKQQNYAAENQMAGALFGAAGTAIAGAAKGGKVLGTPIVKGDHEVNDTVLLAVSPGEIIIPRSYATSPEKAKKFVQQLLENMPKDIKPKKDIRDAIHAKYMKKKV